MFGKSKSPCFFGFSKLRTKTQREFLTSGCELNAASCAVVFVLTKRGTLEIKKISIKWYNWSNLVYFKLKISESNGCFLTAYLTVFHYNDKILTGCYIK